MTIHAAGGFSWEFCQARTPPSAPCTIWQQHWVWDEPWLQAYEPTPEAQAYAHYVAWLAHYASPAEMAVALAVNFPAWGANCGRVGAALRDKYGLSVEATAFFDLFSGPAANEFEEEVRRVVEEGLRQGVGEPQMKRAARLLQSYELMFWNGVYRASASEQ